MLEYDNDEITKENLFTPELEIWQSARTRPDKTIPIVNVLMRSEIRVGYVRNTRTPPQKTGWTDTKDLVALYNLLITRDGYWHQRAAVHSSLLQVFPPWPSSEETLYQDSPQPVSIETWDSPLITSSSLSPAGSREPPWRSSWSTASRWGCTSRVRTPPSATRSARC